MNVLILGAGNIGKAIAYLLQSVGDYTVFLADQNKVDVSEKKIKKIQCDLSNDATFDSLVKENKFEAVISCLPYYCNVRIAKKAKQYQLHYVDLTEDVATTKIIAEISQNADTVFIPHCGISPGYINIIAFDLMKQFDQLETVCLRAGALPQHSNNALHYALTWSTDGLINEYGNPCEAIVNGQYVLMNPLENIEAVFVDGVLYEAFNTSGGVGTLWETCRTKVKNMNYKTLRYPGHCEKIKFLMNDLHLNQHREMLKTIIEESIPKNNQDKVVIYISVSGNINNQFIEKNYTKTFLPFTINSHQLTAIQMSTASSVCAVVDMILTKKCFFKGFVKQEQFALSDFLNNRFGKYYA